MDVLDIFLNDNVNSPMMQEWLGKVALHDDTQVKAFTGTVEGGRSYFCVD